MTLPAVTHDTKRIIAVNQELLDLFRCDPVDAIDAPILEGIIDADMRGLAGLRLRVLREQGHEELPRTIFAFLRHDGTQFQARVLTRHLFNGLYETTFEYLNEY